MKRLLLFASLFFIVSCGSSEYLGQKYGDWQYCERVVSSDIDGTPQNGIVLCLPIVQGQKNQNRTKFIQTPIEVEWSYGKTTEGKERVYVSLINDNGERVKLFGDDFIFTFTNMSGDTILSFEDTKFLEIEKCFYIGSSAGQRLIELFKKGTEMNVSFFSYDNHFDVYRCHIPANSGFEEGYACIDQAIKGYSGK